MSGDYIRTYAVESYAELPVNPLEVRWTTP